MFSTMEAKGKVPAKLCRVLNVGTGQMTAWKRRNVDPPAKYMKQIADFLEVTIDYLITGDDSYRPKLSSVEADIIAMLRQLPVEQVYEFKGELKGYMQATTSPREDSEAV